MASPGVGDELDALFDYNDADRRHQGEQDTGTEHDPATRPAPRGKETGDALGIDEEIKVNRKKRVNVKLDETRLLSQAGIPKLRKLARERFKPNGKSHEYKDLSLLLNIYQLWLDDLYPRAKFADGLQIIEKLGHSRRMQVMRRTWIDEGKPTGPNFRIYLDVTIPTDPEYDTSMRTELDGDRRHRTPTPELSQDLDLYGATPTQNPRGLAVHDKTRGLESTSSLFIPDDADDVQGQPDQDELDALLAEEFIELPSKQAEQGSSAQADSSERITPRDEFNDEWEAMADLEF